MKAPEFIHKKTDGIVEYHLPAPYKRFLDRLVSDSGFKLDEEIRDELLQFISANAIASFGGWDENAILYSLALEVLAKDKIVFLVYFDQQKALGYMQEKADSQRVEWRNAIHFMEGMQYCEQIGIQSPAEFLNAVNYSDKSLTDRYFYLAEIDQENLHRFPKLYCSDVTNWFFLFCEPENKHTIHSILADASKKPDPETILEQCSSIATVQIGGDEGYLDYVLIQSQNDLSNSIRKIEARQNAFKEAYENLLSECQPFDQEWKVYVYLDRFPAILEDVRKMDVK
ncbi:hypothetical protein D3C87_498810 [compost metagenome]